MKTLIFGGKEILLDDLPLRGVKVVIPLINKLVPMAAKQEITEEFYDLFVELLYQAAIFTNPSLTKDMILDLKVKLPELGAALDAVVSCSGLEFSGKTSQGNAEAASQ